MRGRPRPESFREHLFRLDRLIDDVAARAGVDFEEAAQSDRVEGLVEGALETWAELARQAEEMLGRAPSLASLAESVGADASVRAGAGALLRQAGRSWLRPRARWVERVPARGPVVLAVVRVGEPSGWDALALRVLLGDDPPGRRDAGLLVDPDLVAAPVLAAALERTGGGSIDRRAAVEMLGEGGAVLAFLAGAPRRTGASRSGRVDERVVARLALRSRAAVVPVAVAGGTASGLLGRIAPIARGGGIEIAFGTPLRGGLRRGPDAAADAARVSRLSRELRASLQDLAGGADGDRGRA